MGSSGSGRFTDYSGSAQQQGGGGGGSGTDRCRQAFTCMLQEVAQCEYLQKHQALPPVGAKLSIVLDGRLFAVDEAGTKVGALPTHLHYLAACLKAGVGYVGVVTSAAAAPVAVVAADFIAAN